MPTVKLPSGEVIEYQTQGGTEQNPVYYNTKTTSAPTGVAGTMSSYEEQGLYKKTFSPDTSSGGNTIGSIYGEDEVYNQLGETYKKQATEEVKSDEQILQDKMRLYQSEIDAVNKIYSDKVQSARVQGQGRLGSSRASQARSGLLGSDFGEAQTTNVETANREVEDAYRNEQSLQVQTILGRARSEALAEAKAKRESKELGAKNYIEFLTGAETRKKQRVTNLAKSLLAQGKNIALLSDSELSELAKSYGTTRDDILATFRDAKLEDDKVKADIEKSSLGTGIVGEYNFAVKSGWVGKGDPSTWFSQYQIEDANRKAVTSGLNDVQKVNTFNSIVGKYNASPLIQAADRTPVLAATIEKVKLNPGDAAQQMNLSYAYIQALDTYQSAVREGELANLNSIDSKVGSLANSVQKMADGQIVRPEIALQIANAAKDLVDTINLAAQNKSKSFESQASVSGIGEQWRQYVGGFNTPYNPQGGSASTQAETRVGKDGIKYYKVEGGWSDQPPVQAFNQVGGDTNLASGVVGGYDIKSYATDPNHEKRIVGILNKLPEFQSDIDIDSYIRQVAPRSPVTGSMVLNSSRKHNVDPRMIVAIMVQDSTLGTKGKAVSTFNPGNVGNDDTGRLVNYGSWEKGVDAVAKNLSWRKVKSNQA